MPASGATIGQMWTSKERGELHHSKTLLVSTLFGVGFVICAALVASLMSRCFWIEDSGVEEGTVTFEHLVSATPSEQGLVAFAGLLIILGVVAWAWRPSAPSQWCGAQD